MSKLPSITSMIPPDLRRFLDRLREAFDGSDRVVKISDLINSGAFKRGNDGFPEFTGDGGESYCGIPPAPINLIASGAMTTIIVEWEGTRYPCHAYTEIWRCDVDDIGQAVLIGMTSGQIFSDGVGSDAAYYYWVRFVNTDNTKGPYNATQGVLGETAPDVEYLLSQLEGALTQSQLTQTLSERIDVIDLIDGSPDVEGTIPYQFAQTAQSILDEAEARSLAISGEAEARADAITTVNKTITDNYDAQVLVNETIYTAIGDNATAITNEAEARASALETEASTRNALAAYLIGDYDYLYDPDAPDAGDPPVLKTGLIYEEQQLRLNQIESIARSVDALVVGAAESMDTKYTWFFEEDLEGWVGRNVLVVYNNGFLSQDGNTTLAQNAQIERTGLEYSGARYNHLRLRVRRRNGSTWFFRALFYAVTAEDPTGTWRVGPLADAQNVDVGEFATIDFDFSGIAQYMAATITGIRIFTAAELDDLWDFDYIAIGRLGPSASVAAVAAEAEARIDADSVIAKDVSNISTTVGGHTATLETYGTSINGLEAQYTVKVDVDGYVAGYGLAAYYDENGDPGDPPTSEFTILADTFSIAPVASATGNDEVLTAPFFHVTQTRTINNVEIPPGTYMRAAFIHDASITNAKIANAAIDNAKISSLSAAKITFGEMSGDRIEASSIKADRIDVDDLVSDLALINTAYINGAHIKDASIKVAHIDEASITDLSAINADMGTITAGVIQDGESGDLMKLDFNNQTFKIKSATAGARMEMTGSVIKVYDANGNLRVKIGDLSA